LSSFIDSHRYVSAPIAGVLLAVATALAPSLAHAQGRDPAGAEKLYDDGSKLLSAGDWPGACAKFEQSFSLDPAPGAMLNLASCAEHDGKIALAWSRFKEARSLNADTKSAKQQKEIESFIDASLKRIEPRLPFLTVRVTGPTEGVVVKRDGQPTAAGVELPLDPGAHVIEASAPGYTTVKRDFTAKEGAKETIEIVLEKSSSPAPPVEPPPGPPQSPPEPPKPPPATPDTTEGGGMTTMRIAGIVVGSAGLVTLGVSIGLGVVAKNKESELEDFGCDETSEGTLSCSSTDAPRADEVSRDGSTLAIASTVTTFLGAAMVGSGIIMIILGESDEAAAPPAAVVPLAGPGFAGVAVGGRF
jgi:hypothetical protein